MKRLYVRETRNARGATAFQLLDKAQEQATALTRGHVVEWRHTVCPELAQRELLESLELMGIALQTSAFEDLVLHFFEAGYRAGQKARKKKTGKRNSS